MKLPHGSATVIVGKRPSPWFHPPNRARYPEETIKIRFLAILAITSLAGIVSAQQFSHDISLVGLGNGGAAKPFGITYEPSSDLVFVAVCGSFTSPNNVVAVIDPTVDQVIATISVGLYPEEIAFAYDTAGQVRYGAVTNSTSGSVTLWDSNLNVVTTIALPDPRGIGTCYPFGIVVSEDQNRFYVTTQDGTGEIYAIDLNTLSLDAAAGFTQFGRSGGKPAISNGKLLVPTTTYTAAWTGSEAGLGVLSFEGSQDYNLVTVEDGTWTYSSGQEIVRLEDGRLVWGGLFAGERLYILNADGSLDGSIQCSIGAHGIGKNETGDLLAICDLYGDNLAIIDVNQQKEISVQSLLTVGLGYSQPNDAQFLGSKLYVTTQGGEEVVVFTGLPTAGDNPFNGNLQISNPTPAAGESLTITVEGQGLVALVSSTNNQTTVTGYGFEMNIGPNLRIHGHRQGTFSKNFQVPAVTGLAGTHYWVQGAIYSGNSWQVTSPKVVILQ